MLSLKQQIQALAFYPHREEPERGRNCIRFRGNLSQSVLPAKHWRHGQLFLLATRSNVDATVGSHSLLMSLEYAALGNRFHSRAQTKN